MRMIHVRGASASLRCQRCITRSRGISILANLAQVPIALHYLKSEAFGLWMTLVGGGSTHELC